MSLSPREQLASATMIATHEVVSNLAKAKSAMESLVHGMHDLTCLVTLDGRIVWGNSTTAYWLSVEHDVLHEQRLSGLFGEKEWDNFRARLEALTKTESGTDEFQMPVQVNKVLREVLWSLRPFRAISDRRGTIFLAVARDITDVLKERTERAKLESELETAQLMQQAFFPPSHINMPQLEVCSYYRPADQCSGDWWGYFDLGEDRNLICIADVTGHGAASALVTAMTQASCLSFTKRNFGKKESLCPSQLLEEVNEVVCATFKGKFYMTCFAILMDHRNRILRVSNAAHNFPLLLRGADSGQPTVESIILQGNPIGHASDTVFQVVDLPLNKGDKIVLYTDGITECRNPAKKMYGTGALRRSMIRHATKEATVFRDSLVSDALTFVAGEPLGDDIALVTIDVRS